MMGDGINYDPAPAKTTVSIDMGTAGSETAIEAGHVALMADDLTKISYAINVGKKTRRTSKQNIVFSLLVLVLWIPSALIGILSMAWSYYLSRKFNPSVMSGLRVSRG